MVAASAADAQASATLSTGCGSLMISGSFFSRRARRNSTFASKGANEIHGSPSWNSTRRRSARFRLAVDLAEYDVERADDRRHVREHVPARQKIHGGQVRKGRRPDLALVRPVGAVGDEIDAELALGRLDRGLDPAGRHAVAFAVELEMVNGRLHRALHLGAPRRHDLAVLDRERSLTCRRAELLQALLHDPDRLAHLLHADAVAVVIVAVLADRD